MTKEETQVLEILRGTGLDQYLTTEEETKVLKMLKEVRLHMWITYPFGYLFSPRRKELNRQIAELESIKAHNKVM